MEFCENLKRLRLDHSMSQSKLAQKIGINVREVQRYEAGEAIPKTDVAVRIAKLFDISVPELMGIEELPEPTEEANRCVENIKALMYSGQIPSDERNKIFAAIADTYMKLKDKD